MTSQHITAQPRQNQVEALRFIHGETTVAEIETFVGKGNGDISRANVGKGPLGSTDIRWCIIYSRLSTYALEVHDGDWIVKYVGKEGFLRVLSGDQFAFEFEGEA